MIALSGGFDVPHVGHYRMFEEAAKLAPILVFVNSDAWLLRKKGYVAMPIAERMEIISACRWVDTVVPARDDDGTVCDSLREHAASLRFFGNGGDRIRSNTPEEALCAELGIETVYNLGGGKIQSSSRIAEKCSMKRNGNGEATASFFEPNAFA